MHHDDGDAELLVGEDIVWTANHKLRLKKRSLLAGAKGTVCLVDGPSVYVRFNDGVEQGAAIPVRHFGMATTAANTSIGDPFNLETDISCAKTIVAKGMTGKVLAVQGDRVYISVAQDKDTTDSSALFVARKNVRTLAGCIPRRWEFAADFASSVTELLLSTFSNCPSPSQTTAMLRAAVRDYSQRFICA